MDWIDPVSGTIVWSDSWGLPAPGPRADGLPYIKRGSALPDAPKPERVGVIDQVLNGTGIPERLNLLNEVLNPLVALREAGQHSQNMLAPDTPAWDRVGALGGMLSGMAGAVAPMVAASKMGVPAANALTEALTGYGPQASAFMADEFGGLRVWTGGAGDPIKAASDRGAWFSETPDLASDYAGQGGRVLAADIEPLNPISFRHAEQRRTIGDVISTALEGAKDGADFDAARGIVDRLVARYGDDARPLFKFWNADKDVADLFRALGYDAISAAEKSDMKSATWAALDPSIVKMVDVEQAMAGQQQ